MSLSRISDVQIDASREKRTDQHRYAEDGVGPKRHPTVLPPSAQVSNWPVFEEGKKHTVLMASHPCISDNSSPDVHPV